MELAERVRRCLAEVDGVTEKKMFGGLAFLVDGSMAVTARNGDHLMVRVPKDQTSDVLREPGVSEVVMRGRPMNGWVDVDPAVVDADADAALATWVDRGVAAARAASSGGGSSDRV